MAYLPRVVILLNYHYYQPDIQISGVLIHLAQQPGREHPEVHVK
jgi:hypothetical protein